MLPTALPDAAAPTVAAWAADVLSWAQDVLLALVPQGGQRRSRRNAWQAMARESALAADRRDSAAALQQAVLRAEATGRPVGPVAVPPAAAAR